MKLRLTFEVDDHMRRAIAAHYGEPGKATRATVRACIESLVGADLDTILADHEAEKERREKRGA